MDFGLMGLVNHHHNASGPTKHERSDPFLHSGTRVFDSNIPKLSLGWGNLNEGRGIRGSFTPAQWIELEHQAMIYKYFTANVPVPANLLIPIRKAHTSFGFPAFSLGSYFPHSYGRGSFHLGFSGSTDPEPGRCRRTDGKKWRCSRNAVPDQKYCERHINRSRHRSRKPVEGHIGQASSGPTNTNMKGVPALPATMSSLLTSCGGGSNSLTIAQHQSLQPPGANNISEDLSLNRFDDQQDHSLMPLAFNLQSEFGVVSNDSLLNPSHKTLGLLEFNARQTQDHYTLGHFAGNQFSRSTISWPEEVKSDWVPLSMPFPTSSALSSSTSTSTSSPNQKKMTISPLRSTNLLERSKNGLEVSIMDDENGARQSAWKMPIGWGNNTMGGPLGEVLKSASNN